MRVRNAIVVAIAGTLSAALAGPSLRIAHAVPPVIELRLEAPSLEAGDRATVRANLLVPAERIGPVLLTPTTEGTAVEIVRGRLTTAEAEARDEGEGSFELAFAIPVAAHTPGTAVIQVHAHLYVCEPTCREREVTARLTVRVRRRGQPSP